MRESLQTHIIKIPKVSDEWGNAINGKGNDTTKIYFQDKTRVYVTKWFLLSSDEI
jgi:hypothetical protein